jgi:hypothetical protein
MYATVRETFYDPRQPGGGRAQLEAFAAIRARQPGFVGSLAVAAGGDCVLTLALWESEAHAGAALALLEPEARRVFGATRAPPARVIARGPVLDVANAFARS